MIKKDENDTRCTYRHQGVLIVIEITIELIETSQIYMKCYRHGKKILPETTN